MWACCVLELCCTVVGAPCPLHQFTHDDFASNSQQAYVSSGLFSSSGQDHRHLLSACCRTELFMVPVSDEGIFEPEVLLERQRREQQSLERFHEDMRDVSSLVEFNEWLHMTHLCYAVPRQHEFGKSTGLSNAALASY